MNRLVVISGCSGGGKSTLLMELARRGHAIVEEPGRRIVREELQGNGAALPWVDPVAFARRAIAMSLEDLELARNHLGAEADPFGDSAFDFTFTDVSLNIEAGARRSFSLGGFTTLNGKPTRCLFSAIPRPGGGLPQIITGFQFKDWSLADALPELDGTFVKIVSWRIIS